jgi:inhibitor of the pro-sigma K processing machinery
MELILSFLKEHFSVVTVSGIGIVLLALLLVIFAKPVKKVVKLLIHAAFGFILLFALNYFIQYDAFHLEINLANCIVAGVGGIPGVLLLLGYQYYFK